MIFCFNSRWLERSSGLFGPMNKKRNIRLVLQYEGEGYHGWQVQPGVVTIQEVLEERLSRVIQERVRVIAAGRTDAGVHALEQVAHFKTSCGLPAETLQRALNALLPHDIRILMAEEVDHGFHARFSAVAKRYEYRIWNHPVECPFSRRYSLWIPRSLDLEAMAQSALALSGEHDFSAFRASGSDVRSSVRNVLGCGWQREGSMLRFWIQATGFLRYMVRGLVGTMVDVGLGRRGPEHLRDLLAGGKRSLVGATAPARGLFLARVFYPEPWEIDPQWETAAWSAVRVGETQWGLGSGEGI